MFSGLIKIVLIIRPGVIAHICNPRTFQHFGRPRWADHLRSGVPDQPGQHGEISSLLKIQKFTGMVAHACNPSYSGGWSRRITCTWEAEVAVSHCTPAWGTEQDSISKTNKKEVVKLAQFPHRTDVYGVLKINIEIKPLILKAWNLLLSYLTSFVRSLRPALTTWWDPYTY